MQKVINGIGTVTMQIINSVSDYFFTSAVDDEAVLMQFLQEHSKYDNTWNVGNGKICLFDICKNYCVLYMQGFCFFSFIFISFKLVDTCSIKNLLNVSTDMFFYFYTLVITCRSEYIDQR